MKRRMFKRDDWAWKRGGSHCGAWLLVACVVAGGLVVLAFEFSRPAPAPHPGPVVAHAPKAQAAAPRPPTEFEREAAMSPQDLMSRWEPLVGEASKRLKVPPEWIRAVIRMESGGRTLSGDNLPIISDMGAMGIMRRGRKA